MGAQENECQIFQNFKCVITILVKFDIHNSRTSMRNFLWCYYRWFITSSALEKCKKRMQNCLNYSVFFFFVHWKLKSLNFLVDSVLNYRYAYVEIHFFILGSFYLRNKKTFILKPRKTCNKTLSVQELVARTAAGGLFAVCRVLFSFVVCKVWDVSQTPQMKPPASLRRLKNSLITNFVLFH